MEMRGKQIPYNSPESKLVMRDTNGNIFCFSFNSVNSFLYACMHACKFEYVS